MEQQEGFWKYIELIDLFLVLFTYLLKYENTKIHKKLYQASREQEETHTPYERSLSVKAHVAEKLSFLAPVLAHY